MRVVRRPRERRAARCTHSFAESRKTNRFARRRPRRRRRQDADAVRDRPGRSDPAGRCRAPSRRSRPRSPPKPPPWHAASPCDAGVPITVATPPIPDTSPARWSMESARTSRQTVASPAPERLRKEHLGDILLGVVGAPELAEAAAAAAHAVVTDGPPASRARPRPRASTSLVGVALRRGNLLYGEIALDLFEHRSKVRGPHPTHAVAACPKLEDGVGRALAQVGVVHR